MENVPCLKAQKCVTDRRTSVFFPSLSFEFHVHQERRAIKVSRLILKPNAKLRGLA